MDYDKWYEDIYIRMNKQLIRFLSGRLSGTRFTSEINDCVHDVFAILWQNRYKLHDHPNIDGWLFTTCTHIMLRGMKKLSRSIASNNIDIVDDPYIGSEMIDKIAIEIGHDTLAMLLKYYDHAINNEDLAAEMGISIHALKQRVHRIMQRIRSTTTHIFLWALLFVRLMGYKYWR